MVDVGRAPQFQVLDPLDASSSFLGRVMSRLELPSIIKGMRGAKVGVTMVSLQIAFTLAAVVNCYAIVSVILTPMLRDPGIDVDNIIHVTNNGIPQRFDPRLSIEEDLRFLSSLPGVRAVTQIQAMPLSSSGWSSSLRTDPDATDTGANGAVYHVDENALATFGAEIIAGENFTFEDIVWNDQQSSINPATTLLTEQLAKALFPDLTPSEVVGKTVYDGDILLIVKGVIDFFPRPWYTEELHRTFLLPRQNAWDNYRYAIRTEPGISDQLIPEIETGLVDLNRDRIIRNIAILEETARQTRAGNLTACLILIVVSIAFLFVTALGIIGLVNLNIKQRTKQIGIRRALGANKGDITRFFLLESSIICVIGIVAGCGLGILINMALVNTMELETLAWWVFGIGSLSMIVLTLAASVAPAIRASSIPPASATRTV